MSTRLLPLAAMEKILKQCGAERVSDKAKVALKSAIEETAEEIAKRAIKFAHHAGIEEVGDRVIGHPPYPRPASRHWSRPS